MAKDPTIKITRRKLKDYAPHASNPNKHNPRGLQVIEDSINYNGAGRSGVASKENVLLGGNGTWEAMARAGIEDVIEVETSGQEWVIVKRNDLSKDDPRAVSLMLSDNRASQLDYSPDDVLMAELLDQIGQEDARLVQAAGFDDADVRALLESIGQGEPPGDPGAQVDKAAQLQERWQVSQGDVWRVGRHTLICDDATQDEWAEDRVLITDPPYGIDVDTSWLSALHIQRGKPANMSDDKLQGDDGSLDLLFLFEYDRRLIWGFPYIYDPDATGWIVWDKQPGVEERGIVTPVEMASTTLRNGFDIIRVMWGGFYRAAGETREPHPTQKPVQVITPFIEKWTKPDDVIYDPFGGSGTTMVACEQLSRQCRMIEIHPPYCSVILQRMSDMGLSPKRIDGA